MNQRELRKRVEERLWELVESREVYQRKPNTFVLLRVRVISNDVKEAFGFSKVMYSDVFDPAAGIDLAEKKAIAWLAKELVATHSHQTVMEVWCGQET